MATAPRRPPLNPQGLHGGDRGFIIALIVTPDRGALIRAEYKAVDRWPLLTLTLGNPLRACAALKTSVTSDSICVMKY